MDNNTINANDAGGQNSPNNRGLIIGAVIIILIVLGATFYFSTRDSGGVQDQNGAAGGNDAVTEAEAINAKHSFFEAGTVGERAFGKHIIAGEVEVPTLCHLLNVETIIAESFPEQVRLVFTTNANKEQVCAQVVESRRFKVEFNAAKDAAISATWNGKPAKLNLAPAQSSELEAFDIFVKG